MLFLGIVVFGFLWLSNQPGPVLTGGLVLIQLLMISFLLNFRIKVSLHLAIAAYISIALCPINFPMGIGLFVLLPLIAWSRWYLGRHGILELVLGALLGLICGFEFLWLSP
jgi:membrane-associated phospholipid phosphatase